MRNWRDGDGNPHQRVRRLWRLDESDVWSMRVHLAPRTQMIAMMALCGFANLGSIAINIGGLVGMCPGNCSVHKWHTGAWSFSLQGMDYIGKDRVPIY